MKHMALAIVVVFLAIALLSGCGGSGGSGKGTLSGTITDVAGNMIPGAVVTLDGRQVATSLMNGTYKATGIAPGLYNLEASARVNGREWVGTTVVDVYRNGPTMNQHVVVGAWDNLGEIQGTITNLSNDGLEGVRVLAVARYPQNRPADEASVISKTEVTNWRGEYSITDLPATITVNGVKQDIIYDVIASYAGASGQPGGYKNVTKTATISSDPNMVTVVNFTLQPSTIITPPAPPGWTTSHAIYVVSYTVPNRITTRATESAYDAVKSCISERSRKAVAFKRKHPSRAPALGTTIENSVVWYSIWNEYYGIDVPTNLAGFSIYRGTTPYITRTDQYLVDFFRNPSIVTYADTSNELTPGVEYWYGVTSVSTSYLDASNRFNPLAESAMSGISSVTPLGKLNAALPADGGTISRNNPVFSWNPVAGAKSYRVFVYESYPILDALFTPQGDPQRPDHLPAWGQSHDSLGTSITFSDPTFPLVSGRTYWWVVVAADDTDFDYGYAYAISELRSFTAL